MRGLRSAQLFFFIRLANFFHVEIFSPASAHSESFGEVRTFESLATSKRDMHAAKQLWRARSQAQICFDANAHGKLSRTLRKYISYHKVLLKTTLHPMSVLMLLVLLIFSQ
jgi:hypothetical protein